MIVLILKNKGSYIKMKTKNKQGSKYYHKTKRSSNAGCKDQAEL